MTPPAPSEEERRGLERRVYELEQKMAHVVTSVAVTESKVDGLVAIMEERHEALTKGQDLILNRLTPLAQLPAEMLGLREQKLDERVTSIEALRNRAYGALFTVQLLGITGIIGGIIAIVRLVKG